MRTSTVRRVPPPAARAITALTLALATPTVPLAAQTVFFGAGARGAFTAAAVMPVTNDLNAPGPMYAFGPLGTGTVLGLTAGGTSGSAIAATGRGGDTPAYTIAFSSRLGAFGADFTGLGTIGGGSPFPLGLGRFRFLDGATVVGTVDQNFGDSGAPTFFGVAGLAAFDRVEVYANDSDGFTTDDIVIGGRAAAPPATVVPEPGTWALLGSGLLGLAGVARRRRAPVR